MSISSDEDTDSTEPDTEYDSEHDTTVDLYIVVESDAPDSIDLDSNADMERDGDDKEEEDEEKEDKEDEDKDEEDEEEVKDEDNDDDDGKEPQTICQGEMVNTLANYVETMVDDQPIMLTRKGGKCLSITQSESLRRLPHGHKTWGLAHDHERRKLILSVAWSIWGL